MHRVLWPGALWLVACAGSPEVTPAEGVWTYEDGGIMHTDHWSQRS